MNRELIQILLDALIYHTEQTRPIQKTTDAIALAREELAGFRLDVPHINERIWPAGPLQLDLFQC